MTKITKAQAYKLYTNFKPFIMCASKINPNSVFAARVDSHVDADYVTEDDFRHMVDRFRYYNCGPDTGRGVYFYVDT